MTNLRHLIKELGILNTSTYFIHRLLGLISKSFTFSSYYLVAQPIPEKPLLASHRGKSIDIRRIERNDPVVESFPRPREEIKTRFDGNATCFAAFKKDHMIGFIWIMQDSYQEREDRCIMLPHPPHSTAWDCDVYVDPNERLGFTFAKLWDAANEYLRSNGFNWVVSRISAYNPNSVASHRRLGAITVGRTYFLNIGSLQVLFSNISPFFHISFTKAQAPRIIVSPPNE